LILFDLLRRLFKKNSSWLMEGYVVYFLIIEVIIIIVNYYQKIKIKKDIFMKINKNKLLFQNIEKFNKKSYK
jgi:hypothetical protein